MLSRSRSLLFITNPEAETIDRNHRVFTAPPIDRNRSAFGIICVHCNQWVFTIISRQQLFCNKLFPIYAQFVAFLKTLPTTTFFERRKNSRPALIDLHRRGDKFRAPPLSRSARGPILTQRQFSSRLFRLCKFRRLFWKTIFVFDNFGKLIWCVIVGGMLKFVFFFVF